jgi:hypothetical protein
MEMTESVDDREVASPPRTAQRTAVGSTEPPDVIDRAEGEVAEAEGRFIGTGPAGPMMLPG